MGVTARMSGNTVRKCPAVGIATRQRRVWQRRPRPERTLHSRPSRGASARRRSWRSRCLAGTRCTSCRRASARACPCGRRSGGSTAPRTGRTTCLDLHAIVTARRRHLQRTRAPSQHLQCTAPVPSYSCNCAPAAATNAPACRQPRRVQQYSQHGRGLARRAGTLGWLAAAESSEHRTAAVVHRQRIPWGRRDRGAASRVARHSSCEAAADSKRVLTRGVSQGRNSTRRSLARTHGKQRCWAA